MPPLNENTLDNWRKPASENEEQKISNAISMVKDAFNTHPILKTRNIQFVIQGSYGNNTNVRLESDVDICAMLMDDFYAEYRDGVAKESYGFIEGTTIYNDYRAQIIEALSQKFGNAYVKPGAKAIFIESNSYHVHADVVAALQFRNYRQETKNNPEDFVEGIKFYSTDGKEIINYPKVHSQNGITKNNDTNRKFKRTVRLFKRIRNAMINDQISVPIGIRSFLLESLLWNVPNNVFNNSTSWNELLRNAIISLYNNLKNEENCKNWGDITEKFYLFHAGRNWTREDAKTFMIQIWNYLGYGT